MLTKTSKESVDIPLPSFYHRYKRFSACVILANHDKRKKLDFFDT